MNHDIPKFDIKSIEQGLSVKALSIMKMFDDNIFIIEKYAETEEQYDLFIDTIINNMLEGFEHKEFRQVPVQFKFRDDPDEPVKWLQFRHFIINTMFWRPQLCIDPNKLNDEHIITAPEMKKLSRSFIKNYIDTYYIARYNRTISSRKMNMVICDMMFGLSRISAKFNPIIGLGASIETFIDLANRIPEFEELTRFKLDESKQPNEMEEDIIKMRNKQINLILNDNVFNILKPMLQPDAGIKPKQFSEFTLNIGTKPDIEGKTIASPINGNYLRDGLKSVSDVYKNAIPGRKSAIMNNEYMGKSGYMAILVSIACSQVTLSKTVEDCNTVNPLRIKIESQAHLNKLDGRRYKFLGQRHYNTIVSSEDSYLIGQTILLRSPVTCSAPDGMCKECYGELFYTNMDLQCAGIFSSTEIMNPVMQGILSAKHHQETKSNPIIFQEEFSNFFELYSTDIILCLSDDIDSFKYQLVIYDSELENTDGSEEVDVRKKKNVIVSDDEDSQEGFTLTYFTKRFEIWEMSEAIGTKHNKLVNVFKFNDFEDKELYMHEDFILQMITSENENGKYYYIPLENINSEEFIFKIDINNNELTTPLKRITKLLDSVAHEDCTTYEEMVQLMIQLLIDSKIAAMSIHGEVIIRQLIRRKTNELKRPNFSNIITKNDYDILTIKSALRKNPSITTSLATNYLKKQLIELQCTFDKTATSVFDPLFRRDLSYMDIEDTKF